MRDHSLVEVVVVVAVAVVAVAVTVVAISVVAVAVVSIVVTVVVSVVNSVLDVMVVDMAVRSIVHSGINVVVDNLVVVDDVVVSVSLVVDRDVLDRDLLVRGHVLCPWVRLSLVPLGVLELHGLHGVVFALDGHVSVVLVPLGLDRGVCVSDGLHARVGVLHRLMGDVFVMDGLDISVLVVHGLLLSVDVVAGLLVVRVLILGVVHNGVVMNDLIFSVNDVVVDNIIIDVAIVTRLNKDAVVVVVVDEVVIVVVGVVVIIVVIIVVAKVVIIVVAIVVVIVVDDVVLMVHRLNNDIMVHIVVHIVVNVVMKRLINNEVSVVIVMVDASVVGVAVMAVVVAISVLTVTVAVVGGVVDIVVHNAVGLSFLLRGSSSRGLLLGILIISLSSGSSLVVVASAVVAVAVVGTGVVGVVSREVVERNLVLHLAAKEDLGKGKTNGVAELVEVLVVPLSLSIGELVVHILAVDDEVVLNMEDEVPRVGESLGHLAEFIEIGTNSGLALLELVGDVVNDMAEVLNGMKNRVEGSVLELINDTAEALPDVLRITEALNAVRDLSLNRTGEKTLKNLAHAEESEVHIGALHCLEVVHLLILLVIDLIEELLPVVVEVEEEFLMVDHLGLSVEEHSSSLTEVLASVDPLAHAIVMETLTSVLEHVDAVDDERLVGLKKDLLGVEERLSHPLDLLIIVMINLTAVVEHVADVGHGKTELINSLGGLLVGAVPESTHGVFEMMLNRVGIRNAVSDVGHAMEVKGTNEETLHDARNLGVIMSISSLGGDSDYCSSSESTVHFDLSVCEND